jgi:hypothetical protein
MKFKIAYFICFFLLLFAFGTFASEVIWLSGDPPKKASKQVKSIGMQRLAGFRGKRGKETLILWVRSGTNPIESEYLNSTHTSEPVVFVFSPEEKLIKAELSDGRMGFALTYDGSLEGFYNIYIIERFVHGDTLYVQIAKAEKLSHSCRNGHKGIRPKIPPHSFPGKVPFEIIRKRIPNEDFHTFLASGDEVSFMMLLNGNPVENANVLITTQKQWAKSLKTNKDGEITFQILGDYFSKWKELNNKEIYKFLLKADYTVIEEGVYNKQAYKNIHYTCTMTEDYIPSETVYKSYVWALAVFVFVVTFLSFLIYLNRKRKRRIYR